MDAATAARMSDPEHNPLFRRRWLETPLVAVLVTPRSTTGVVGPIGLALIEAWRRKQRVADPAVAPGSAALGRVRR
jgi:hypothetical protein